VTFGYYLVSFLASVYLLVSQKETNIWPSIHTTNKKKPKTQIKKLSFCMRIRVSVQRNHLFGKTKTQKTAAKVKNLRTEEKPSFVYLCICVSGQRNHSLMGKDGQTNKQMDKQTNGRMDKYILNIQGLTATATCSHYYLMIC
jgi:hypothetical protein